VSHRDARDDGARPSGVGAHFTGVRRGINTLSAIILHAALNMISAAPDGFRKNSILEFIVTLQENSNQSRDKRRRQCVQVPLS
jgi:hypothetical protein